MKNELRELWQALATSTVMFGLVAAVARFMLGDRAGGWGALVTYIACSLFVAWVAAFYFADEPLTENRRSLYLLLLSFVAKDVLMALAGIAAQFKVDPFGVFKRLMDALTGGGPKP